MRYKTIKISFARHRICFAFFHSYRLWHQPQVHLYKLAVRWGLAPTAQIQQTTKQLALFIRGNPFVRATVYSHRYYSGIWLCGGWTNTLLRGYTSPSIQASRTVGACAHRYRFDHQKMRMG